MKKYNTMSSPFPAGIMKGMVSWTNYNQTLFWFVKGQCEAKTAQVQDESIINGKPVKLRFF